MATGFNLNSVLVNIKFTSSSMCQVHVDVESTVSDLKDVIQKQTGISAQYLQLIFAGRMLQDNSSLKDLAIGDSTVLHAFKQKQPTAYQVEARNSHESRPTCRNAYPHQYYVFCKSCKSLQPGKLRVMCASCKQGQIVLDTLDREPDNFDDVLLPGRIHGECKSESCGSNQAARFYFKCAGHHSSTEESNSVLLHHIQPNRKQSECITCSEVYSPLLVYPCDRRHAMCLDCFKSYCIVKLNERRFEEDAEIGYSLPCPVGCDRSLIQDTHHFYLLGDEQYERYKNFGAEEYVIQNGGMLCPSPGCGSGFLLDSTQRKVICPTCSYEFCYECREGYHGDRECVSMEASGGNHGVDLEQEIQAVNEMESLSTIVKTTKPCPGCKTKTEKNGGCMHMKCSRCNYDWCWVCEKEWTRDCQGDHWFG